MSYVYNPQLGRMEWTLPNQPQSSSVNVTGLSPTVSATPMYQALGNRYVPNQTLLAQMPYTPNSVQAVPGTAGIPGQMSAQSALGNTLTTSNSMAMAQNARPEFWSLEGAFGSQNGNYSGWAGGAIQGLTALGGMYLGYQNLRLQKKELAERTALQRANYRNSARALNSAYRDQASGRGYNGMNQSATSALGQQYANRKVSESY